MSLLSALLLLTLASNPSHPSSYHYSLLLTFSAILIAITHPGTLTAKTPSCSKLWSESQDLSHLVLDWPVFDPMRRAIFGHSLSILNFWSRPWGVT